MTHKANHGTDWIKFSWLAKTTSVAINASQLRKTNNAHGARTYKNAHYIQTQSF